MADRDREFLQQLQSMSLYDKYNRTLALIGEWHNHYDNNVYVSLSGGKDSTVLADIDAQWCSMVHKPLNLCFSNTGLEYPEIQRHVRNVKEYFGDAYGIEVNLDIVTPKMRFDEVVSTYGYPLIGKEVAEAIYYARRIRSAEREKDGARTCTDDGNDSQKTSRNGRNPNFINTSHAPNRRSILQGRWGGTEPRNAMEENGTARDENAEPHENGMAQKRNRGSKWEDWPRKCLQPNPNDPRDRDNFWNKPKEMSWADWRRGCL